MKRHAKMIIIGSGPAGYTAGIYAARAMLKPLLIEGIQPGGQMTVTTDVENYPGFADVIQGPWLMDQMRAQAVHVGTEIIADHIDAVDLKRAALLAQGRQRHRIHRRQRRSSPPARRPAGSACPRRTASRAIGVSACATCDGFFFRGKNVLVVGGGNTAVEESHLPRQHRRAR